METIPSQIRDRIYVDGGVEYTPLITIGDTPIDIHNIKTLKIERPATDTSQKSFRLGNFIADKLTMTLYKPDTIDLSGKLHLAVQMTSRVREDNSDPYSETIYTTTVQMGEYNIETSPIDYYKKAEIVALDNSVLFKKNVNIHDFFTEIIDPDTGELIDEYITAEDLLTNLCTYFGVTLGTYPNVNRARRTSSYDSTLSGKQYIAWVAETMGGNAKIDRLGRLCVVPVKSVSQTTINGLKGKSFKLADTEYLDNDVLVTKPYHVTGVRYDTGTFEVHYDMPNTTSENIIPINTNNPFFNGTTSDMQSIIDEIGASVCGLTINRLEATGFADITLDPYDFVTYILGDKSYNTYYSSTITFNGAKPTVVVKVNIPSDNVEATTNTIETNEKDEIRAINTTINQLTNTVATEATKTQRISDTNDNRYDEIIDKIDTNDSDIQDLKTLTTTMRSEINDTYTKDEINAIISGTDENGNVVTVVRTVNSTFDINGLTIDDSETRVKSNLSSEGLKILDKDRNDEEILYVGYNSATNETQVRSRNIKVEKYLEMGTYSRFEDYTDDNNRRGTGCFWVGD